MSVKPSTINPPKRFDLGKFEAMIEPFNVRIEKIKGSMKYPIPMPPTEDGGAPGTGLSKDQVRTLEAWVVNEWSGGGHYGFAITDSSSPPLTMEWIGYYPTTEFPEKVPPTLAGAFNPQQPSPGSVAALHPNTQQQRMVMASFPGSGSSLPQASLYAAPGQPMPAPAPAPSFFPPTMSVPYAMQPQMYPQATQNSEANALREQLNRAREEAAQREFERRLAEIKAESDRRHAESTQAMQTMVKEMSETFKAQMAQVQAAKPVGSPEIEQLREQLRRQEEQMRAERMEADRARRESELREQIRASQEATAKLVEESNRRFESFMAANANKGPDPQFLMFQTMMQNQMEAMKEIARTSQTQFDRMQNLMMSPRDILAITRDSATGAEQQAAIMARQWEQMFGISRQLTEQAAQLNSGGGGNEVIGLVRDGVERLTDWAGRYTGGKSKEAVAQVTAQAEIAKANAEVQKAQLEQMAQLARMEAAIKNGTAVQMPDGSFRAGPGPAQPGLPASGLSGAAIPTNGKPWIPPKTPRTDGTNAPAPATNGGNVVPFKQPEGLVNARKIKGRTDVEWFGPIVPNVNELRNEVAKFIKGLEQKPPVKDGATPQECATAIQLAAAEIMARQIPIPAMVEMLLQGMVADFLDVLLPDAPQLYRDDVAQILMKGEENPNKPGDDSGDDEDDDDDDDGNATDASGEAGDDGEEAS